jgi:hypothetical protein
MADRQGLLKRFKACKIRVNTRFSKAVSLKADKYVSRTGSKCNAEPDILASEELGETFDNPTGATESQGTSLSKHHLRHIKENDSWIAIRQNILQGRLEGEAFIYGSS